MPKTRKLQLSFSGGEIDTQMYGRIDAQQYQSGLATCKNWMVDPRGSLRRRPGMQRVAEGSLSDTNTSLPSRIIPFTYSVDQQLAVELTENQMRFHTNGQTLVWADMKKFDMFVSSNTLTFDAPHGLADGDEITFYASVSPGQSSSTNPIDALPPPFNDKPLRPSTSFEFPERWEARVVDSTKIQVWNPVTSAVEPITDNGLPNFDLYVFKSGGSRSGKVGPAREYKRRFFSTQIGAGGNYRANLFRPDSSSDYCLQFGENPNSATGTYLLDDWKQGECVQILYEGIGAFKALPGIPKKLYVDYTANGTAGCLNNRFGLRTRRDLVGTAKGGDGDYVSAEEIVAAFDGAGDGQVYGSPVGRGIWITQFHEVGELLYLSYRHGMGLPWFSDNTTNRVYRVHTEFLSEDQSIGITFDELVDANCDLLPNDGSFSLEHPYIKEQLFDIEYDQSGDVVTLTHPDHSPRELKRFSDINWSISPVDFSPELPAPSNVDGSVVRGEKYKVDLIEQVTAGTGDRLSYLVVDSGQPVSVPLAAGDNIFIEAGSVASLATFIGEGYCNIAEVDTETLNSLQYTKKLTIRNREGEVYKQGSATLGVTDVFVYYSVASAEKQQSYKITSVNERGQESVGSETKTFDNVITVPGSKNIITFDGVAGARSYNVYKDYNGAFGYIGKVDAVAESSNYQFEDDNIGPDMSRTLPILDNNVQQSFQPRASARFEQRRCFGGSDALPRTLFMSRTGTESSFSYRFPTQPDDRISVDLASREAHVIRHIVPIQDLLMMTQQGEFRVTAINSDALTPSTIAIRQQSYIGSNNVHPQVVNNSVVFCSARGGHARELNFRAESQGYLTGDLSLRAAHLFDGFTLNDLAYSKAPVPVLWFVSSSGKLLCLTYIPEEQVLAWHQHETSGTVESVCSVAEGDYDNLYLVVKRGDDRSIERIVQVREEALEDAVYLDASVSHNGTNTDSTAKFKVFGSNLYKAGDTVTVTAYDDDGTTVRKGLFSSEDEGDVLEFTSGGQKYRVKFETDVGNQTYFTGKLLTDWPDALKNTATSSWAWARKTFSGYSHLAGQTVTVLADGSVEQSLTVNSDGEITLSDYAVKVCAGLTYTSQAKTLPMSLEIEAGAQGRTKNINQVFVRVEDTGALQVGMDEASLKSVSELSDTELKTGEFRTSVPSTWDEEGQIVVEATGAAPASLLNITTQVSIGD